MQWLSDPPTAETFESAGPVHFLMKQVHSGGNTDRSLADNDSAARVAARGEAEFLNWHRRFLSHCEPEV